MLNRISTGSFYEINPPFVQLIRGQIRQFDAINLRDPRGPATMDLIEFFAAALDLENLRENVAEATAIILERFRLARPMATQLIQKIPYRRNRFARHLRFEFFQRGIPSSADQRCLNAFRFSSRSRFVGSLQAEQFTAAAPLDSGSPIFPLAAFARFACTSA